MYSALVGRGPGPLHQAISREPLAQRLLERGSLLPAAAEREKRKGCGASDVHSRPSEWRAAISQLVVAAGERQADGTRIAARKSVAETIKFEEMRATDKLLLMPKNRYKKFMKDWEGWASDEASSKSSGP